MNPIAYYLERKVGIIMKRAYKVDELDCANCAAKMERAAAKVEGVDSVAINFMAQKITLEANDDIFMEVLDKVEKVMQSVEKDVSIVR